MSEPVGNSPRSSDSIPGNSHKDRVEPPSESEKEARVPAEKIIEGKVIVRKPPWWKRIARNLVAEDAQDIGDYLLTDVVAPALRNLIADTIKGGTDRVIYGSGRGPRRGGIGERREGLRTRYDQMSDRGEPRRMLSREARAKHDFSEVVLESRAEAIDTIENLIARVEMYGSASVSDLYDFIGTTGSHADRRWGWTNLNSADVRQVRSGWLLDLPRPEPLR